MVLRRLALTLFLPPVNLPPGSNATGPLCLLRFIVARGAADWDWLVSVRGSAVRGAVHNEVVLGSAAEPLFQVWDSARTASEPATR